MSWRPPAATVLPVLTRGLAEVCEVRPEDPVDYLAEWLFRHNPASPPPDHAAAPQIRGPVAGALSPQGPAQQWVGDPSSASPVAGSRSEAPRFG